MTATAVLELARAAGVELSATPEGNLRWRCRGALPDELREALVACKGGLLKLLAAEVISPECALSQSPADLPLDWHFAWDERAAIMEFEGGILRERAEALALADVQAMRRERETGQ